jgi:hypothetical protein
MEGERRARGHARMALSRAWAREAREGMLGRRASKERMGNGSREEGYGRARRAFKRRGVWQVSIPLDGKGC